MSTRQTNTTSPVVPAVLPLASEKPASAQIASAALLRGAREVLIRHGDEVYRLRHTRSDKLILTK